MIQNMRNKNSHYDPLTIVMQIHDTIGFQQ